MSSVPTQTGHRPVLFSLGGLPATGKTTIARILASRLRAAYVRIDSIESALERAEGGFRHTNGWELPPGYAAGYAVAADQLRVGLDVVAESVNPVRSSRDAWRAAGMEAGARVVEVELVCSVAEEHRRRAEERVPDIAGLGAPTWERITDREYHPWERDRVVVDTAIRNAEESAELIRMAAPGGRDGSSR